MMNTVVSAYRESYEYSSAQLLDLYTEQYEYDEYDCRMESVLQAYKEQKKACDRRILFRQKATGWCFALGGVILPFLLGGDATCSFVMIPVGLHLILTKQRVG